MAFRHDPARPTICRRPGCRRSIRFVTTKNGKQMPIDVTPDESGNVAVYVDETGTWRGRVLGGAAPHRWERVYMPHAATCAARQPTPRRLPAGVVSLDQYRRQRTP
jgi:hypothetical protein